MNSITRADADHDRITFRFGETVSGSLLTRRSLRSAIVQSTIQSGKHTATTYPVIYEMKAREIDSVNPDEFRCRRIERLIRHADTNKVLTHEMLTFTDYDPHVSEDVFFLSHYGLPEPSEGDAPAKTASLTVRLLLIAVGFALLGGLLRYVAYRRRISRQSL